MQPKKERDAQIKISSLSQVLMQIGKNNISFHFLYGCSKSQQKHKCLSNVWTKGPISLRRHLKHCTIFFFFLPNLLFQQGSLKVKILGAGEGMVKQTHSCIAGGKGKP